jgi:pimeloyl-ACP methyl ester carboxylesterase
MHQDIRFCKAQDGVRLAYAVSGEGPPLVMAATWLTHLEHQWRSLAWRPWLEAFVHDHKLLRYDARGCGLSDRDAPDLSFDNWVRDFARVIDAATFNRFAILATCWGGPIAIEYAARHPERGEEGRPLDHELGRRGCLDGTGKELPAVLAQAPKSGSKCKESGASSTAFFGAGVGSPEWRHQSPKDQFVGNEPTNCYPLRPPPVFEPSS